MKYLKKIINVDQTRLTDLFTINNELISSIDLMERAAKRFVKEAIHHIAKDEKVLVVCGTGNNGGDGFAVCRILESKGFNISSVLIKFSDHLSKDCQTNFDQIKQVPIVSNSNELPDFKTYDVIIDALFGSGISRPVEGIAADVIESMNESGKRIYSTDLPSGLFADKLTVSNSVVHSDFCISFQRPKLSFFYPEHSVYLKNWKAIDIGLNEEFIESQDSKLFVIDNSIHNAVKKRERFSHKGTYGHALIIAGSFGKMGAAVLSSKASLRSGAGLVSCFIPLCGYDIMQTANPEVMCLTDGNENCLSEVPNLEEYNVCGIGPGLGTQEKTQLFFKQLLENCSGKKIVLDADALNILSIHKDLLKLLPQDSILTPHPKEFERLTGSWKNSEERLKKLQSFCIEFECIVVLKDAYTAICDAEGNIYFNKLGNAGMATAGCGDVLTGIITGLLAQGYTALSAALIGVHFHSLAGDSAKKSKGENALIASDIIENLRIEKT